MSDLDTKTKRSQTRKRNLMARTIKDYGEHKGAFSLKVIDPRKGEYKRKKIRTGDVYANEEDD